MSLSFKTGINQKMLIGYARVSTTEQDTRLQLDALKLAGCQVIFHESGSSIGPRPELQKALSTIKPGDTLIVWKIDRLARSLVDLLGIIDKLEIKGASIRSLTEHIDTGTPIGEFVLHILGAFAQLERSIIRERSMAGQKAARERGSIIGRKRSATPDQEQQVLNMRTEGFTMAGIAQALGLSQSAVKRTIYRAYKPNHSSLR
jgi:DNA invertase Pin-like site-specific DNA recombinase